MLRGWGNTKRIINVTIILLFCLLVNLELFHKSLQTVVKSLQKFFLMNCFHVLRPQKQSAFR